MLELTIRRASEEIGWRMTSEYEHGLCFLSFHRKTLSGVPFCFSVETEDYELDNVIREILSFVDALDPKLCAWEWMVKSGVVHPSMYNIAISDMDEIRTQAWLLACNLSELENGLLSDYSLNLL